MNLILILDVLAFIFCLFLGSLLFLRPAQAIEMQRRLYLAINWKVEPVSMEKELRMTRYMGIFTLVMVAAAMALSINLI
jgi:hypothetical protein